MNHEGRIFVDLNKSDVHGNIPATIGTHRDIEMLGLALSDGMRVGVYDKDADLNGRDYYFLAEATAVFDHVEQRWTFRVDETTLRTAPR